MQLQLWARLLWLFLLPALLGGARARAAEGAELPPFDLEPYHLDARAEEEFLKQPAIQQHLVDRSQGRPIHCPLRAESKHWQLFERLQQITTALRQGRCYQHNKEYVDGLQKVLSGPPPPAVPLAPASGAAVSPLFTMAYHNQLFNTLNVLTSDNNCLVNIKDRGLLPVLADVITSAGLVSALMPTPNGLLVGLAGLTIGSSLKVLLRLFSAPFQWKSSVDRKQFLDLNCQFFDVRRDIEALDFFEVKDTHHRDNLTELSRVEEMVRTHLEGLKQRQELLAAYVQRVQGQFLRQHLGFDSGGFAKQLAELLASLDPSLPSVAPADGQWLHALLEAKAELETRLASMPLPPEYAGFISSLLGRLSWSNLAGFLAMERGHFLQTYRQPLEHYLGSLRDEITRRNAHELAQWFHLPRSSTPAETVGQYLERVQGRYLEAISRLAETLGRLQTRLGIMKSKNPKRGFSAGEDGAHATYDIIDVYRFVQRQLFGKLGHGFLHYFSRSMHLAIGQFTAAYQKFLPQMLAPQLSPLEERWACRNAQQLRIVWEQGLSAAYVANEFIDTNRGIFHRDTPGWRFLLKIFPLGRSFASQVRRQALSVEVARDIVERQQVFTPELVDGLGWKHQHNIGRLMVELNILEEQRQLVEDFWMKKQCFRYL